MAEGTYVRAGVTPSITDRTKRIIALASSRVNAAVNGAIAIRTEEGRNVLGKRSFEGRSAGDGNPIAYFRCQESEDETPTDSMLRYPSRMRVVATVSAADETAEARGRAMANQASEWIHAFQPST